METLTPVYLRIAQSQFRTFSLQCFTEQESLTGQTGLLLKLRAEDILSNLIESSIVNTRGNRRKSLLMGSWRAGDDIFEILPCYYQ